jgi:two-component system phosphate regulon sensor histidine kinase PhoR
MDRDDTGAQDTAHSHILRLLADTAFDALLVLDARCQVIALNHSAQAIFAVENAVGLPLSEVAASPELEMMVQDLLTNREESLEEQLTIGRRVYRVRVNIMPQAEDTAVLIGLALQDISDLVRLNRARRDMVANISHELRTPIANIRLIIDGLFHDQEKPKRKQSISSLRAIARETDSLLWMAEELLDLSMIESGQAIMRMVEVPVYEIVDDAIERVYDQSAAKELELVHDVPKTLLALCDRDKVRRVLTNLVHNAVKWSPPGETITIHAKDSADEVLVSVYDNGPGVPDDQTERIFERFYQVDASRSVSEGTGLGLAICKHIIEAHGGRIWAQGNSKGKGGRFYFTLPKADIRPE